MKKFIEYLADFLKDRNSGSSYKRLVGFACFIVSVILAFTGKDYMLVGIFLSTSMGNSIASLFEKDKK